MRKIAIVGAGGLAREFLDVIEAINLKSLRDNGSESWRFIGFIAESLDAVSASRGAHLGGDFVLESEEDFDYVIGIGDGQVRERLDALASTNGRVAAVLVHPAASIGLSEVRFGPGTVVCANASITTNIRFGRHCHINLNSTVGHDTTIGAYVSLNPGSNISGNVRIGDASMIGTGAQVLQGTSIGARATIGAGSVVTRDIPDDVIAFGIPAKVRAP